MQLVAIASIVFLASLCGGFAQTIILQASIDAQNPAKRIWVSYLASFAWRAFRGGGAMLFLALFLAPAMLSGCGGGSGGGSPSSGGGVGAGGGVTGSTISGSITPTSLGAGARVDLTGAASATATADASGSYSFTGLANGAYTVTPSATSANFSPASAQVTLSGSNVTGVNFTASSSSNVVFFDDFTGTSLGSAWTVIQRRGPASQSENECNTTGAVSVAGGNLTITTSATPAVCGDAVTASSQLPYTTGDVQWTNLNFTYGTVEVRAKFPPANTKTWPAIWLLGSNCQAASLINGSTDNPFNGCPAQGNAAYQEIDMVECDLRSWCHMVVAQGSGGWSSLCAFPVDANYHVFSLTWNASTVSVALDGTSTGCSFPNTSLHGPMFLLMQTQTTNSSGVAGNPNNAALPTTFQIDYVRVTQP